MLVKVDYLYYMWYDIFLDMRKIYVNFMVELCKFWINEIYVLFIFLKFGKNRVNNNNLNMIIKWYIF